MRSCELGKAGKVQALLYPHGHGKLLAGLAGGVTKWNMCFRNVTGVAGRIRRLLKMY
jgi:hypothetical protein